MSMTSIPGEILLEEYLKPLGISQNAMARAITEIILGKQAVTRAKISIKA